MVSREQRHSRSRGQEGDAAQWPGESQGLPAGTTVAGHGSPIRHGPSIT